MFEEPLESFAKLNLPYVQIDLNNLHWVRYNPRKEINRFGASITSLDGGTSGTPDLDSLYEYNKLNMTNYRESQFQKLTAQGTCFKFLTDQFDLGRSHFIRLGAGGFFPYHRDLGSDVFRIIYCIKNCHPTNFVWLQGDRALSMQDGSWYYVNTKQTHATFSFFGCEFAVFNMIKSERSYRSLLENLEIK